MYEKVAKYSDSGYNPSKFENAPFSRIFERTDKQWIRKKRTTGTE
jgi:hypothetical protein